ncbi:glycosyltransferase [Paenalcaligenes niemegkensis]|uniref:glycosyltransferase family 2 protein n=1 Tax=Paenalcaligenes niemegkensis TaxID=2895469 RepID=UPI001EE97875|nr:glycosyltransferase [Paenalcaligenes niemegkensis]MCQ9617213.1 glycosyltransferase [Paenalcaligenes niemegkensis]
MNTDARLQLSVIVPTYRRPDLLERCLQALQRQTLLAVHYEVIVCDDGPSEGAQAAVCNAMTAMPHGPMIHYVEITDTQGPAAARNRGWQYSQSPIVAFTDDDTVPDPGWLEAGLNAMADGADVVTGQISMPLPEKPSDLELDAAGLVRAEFVTANCFIRRDILQEVGGFDERFGMAWREDSDLHFTLLKAGYSIVKEPAALVVHPLRQMPFAAGIGMQKKVLFDVLLYGKHPRLYRERIRRGPPWLYLFISFLMLLTVFTWLFGFDGLALTSLSLWVLLTLYFFLRRLRHSALTARNVTELLLTSIVIPPLSIFWRIVGVSRYGARFP